MSVDNAASEHELGFVTVASGNIKYAEMAVDMALSLREQHSEPIWLVADEASARHVNQNYPGIFDGISLIPAGYDLVRTHKFAIAEAAPCKRGIFIDADTLVLAPLDKLIAKTRGHGFVMMGAFLPPDSDRKHHGRPVRGLIREFGLERYFTNHSAAFGYEREYARSFLRECHEVYTRRLYTLRHRLQGFVGDELAFGIVAARRGMEPMDKPFPVLWSNELARLQPHDTWKPLCHFINAPAQPALDWMMDEVRRRRRERGFALVSEQHWRQKAARRQKSRPVKRLIARIKGLICGKELVTKH